MEALAEIEREKGVSMDILIDALEAALISAYKRNFGSLQNVSVIINRETGEIKVYARKNVVEEVNDDRTEILLGEAREKDPRYEIGDVVEIEVTPRDFGRIAAQTAKQVVVQRIREAERGIIYEEFSNREGDIVTGIVQRQDQKNVYIDLGKTEATLGPTEQIPGEGYKHGDRIKTYIVEVKKTTKGPQILVSRTHPGLLKRLFELEVPEIHDGIVELKSVAREAGARSKIAVYSRDENVDPVGACVGPKGMRVQTIVNELKGEKIDIVKWNQDSAKFVANALSPAKVIDVTVFEDDKVARVVVPDYQLSLAIGKEGQNARLAAKLTGWKIDIKNETQMEEIMAAQEFYDQGEDLEDEYAEGEYAEGDYAEGDYVEGDYTEDDYVEGDYAEGDYAEGDYVEGEYAEGDYAEGEYAEGEYEDWEEIPEDYHEYENDEEYNQGNEPVEFEEGEHQEQTSPEAPPEEGGEAEADRGENLEFDDETLEVIIEEIKEEETKPKTKKAKKGGKKQPKVKRKKLSIEEVGEYLEELEEDT